MQPNPSLEPTRTDGALGPRAPVVLHQSSGCKVAASKQPNFSRGLQRAPQTVRLTPGSGNAQDRVDCHWCLAEAPTRRLDSSLVRGSFTGTTGRGASKRSGNPGWSGGR